MATRKIGRKARALERAKAHANWVDREFQKRRDKEQRGRAVPAENYLDTEFQMRRDAEQGPREYPDGIRKERRWQVAVFVAENPNVSTRVVERRFAMHRDTITSIREEIGFVVPKKDYRCYKARYGEHSWPEQPGERRGICACGCGGKTTQTKNGSSKTGMKPGDFFRFIAGHQWLLRRRLFMPKGWRSSHERMQEREVLRRKLIEQATKLPRYTSQKVGTFEDLRNRLKKIEIDGHNVVDQQVARMINIGRTCFIGGDKVPPIVHANAATKAEWLERLVSVSASMGVASIEFSELKRRFNEPMLVNHAAVSRLLNRQRLSNPNIPFISFPLAPRKREPVVQPITEHYPFGGSDDLLQFILSVIPSRFGSDARGDIAQDMALAVIEGSCKREELQSRVGDFVHGYHRKFSAGKTHNMISLDAPVNLSTGNVATLHELLSLKDSMQELNGGVNYETRGTWFDDRSEQWDGEICARY